MSTAIAHALHDVADALRSLKPEEIRTIVNVSDGAIPTGEAITLAMANDLGLTADDFTVPDEEIVEDIVAAPNHYRRDGEPECIEVTGKLDFVWGSAMKYLYRCLSKGNPVQDLEKALRYVDFAGELGLEKPYDADALVTYSGVFLASEDESVEERRASAILCLIDGPQTSIGELRNEIEQFIATLKEDQK